MVDPLTFFRHLNWIDGRPLLQTMEPFRRQIFSDVFTATLPDGRRRYNLCVTSRGKKNWKSADLILAALYCLLAEDSPHGTQCYLYANDEGQAGDDLDLARKLVKANPPIAAAVRGLKGRIERVDGAGFLEIQPKDAIGSHGKTYRFCGFDEIHGYQDWSLLEALQLDPSRDGDSIQWVTSYAGFDQRQGSPLWDLYCAGKAGNDPRMYFNWSDGDAANPSKIVTAEYLAQQKLRLPDALYRRLHRNEWSTGQGGLFNMDDWDSCTYAGGGPMPPNPDVPVAIGVDASVKRDRTAVVGLVRVEGQAVLAFRKTWQPSPDNPLDFESSVEAYLKQVAAAYQIRTVHYDPFQLENSAQRLRRVGVPMVEYVQSLPNIEAMSQALFDAVKFRTLVLYPDPELRTEASNAVAAESRHGRFHIAKDKSWKKVDSIVALAMALMALGQTPTGPPVMPTVTGHSIVERVLAEAEYW